MELFYCFIGIGIVWALINIWLAIEKVAHNLDKAGRNE